MDWSPAGIPTDSTINIKRNSLKDGEKATTTKIGARELRGELDFPLHSLLPGRDPGALLGTARHGPGK